MKDRPTGWWLSKLQERRTRQDEMPLKTPPEWRDEEERSHAIKFFNAAFRAEESGITQAHELSSEVMQWDPELAEVLRLYGDEEGWHQELLTEFLSFIGGDVEPMGRVTRTLYRLYGRAKRMETIILTNLMFETIGSTTYRLTLRGAKDPSVRQMLQILTRDEAFHVPLNLHFLRRVLARSPRSATVRVKVVYRLLFVALCALPLASRPKSKAFDGIDTLELSRAYAERLGRLFRDAPEIDAEPPRLLCRLLGVRLDTPQDPLLDPSPEMAERMADRSNVAVAAL